MIIGDILDYLELNNIEQIKYLKKLSGKYSFLKNYAWKKILLIDKAPNYNNFNISQIIFLFSHIWNIKLDYYNFPVSEVDIEMDMIVNSKTKLIQKKEENDFKPKIFSSWNLLDKIYWEKSFKDIKEISEFQDEYDLVICNWRWFIMDYAPIIEKLNYKDIFYFNKNDWWGLFLEYPDLTKNTDFLKYFKTLLDHEKEVLTDNNSIDVFMKWWYVFFSRILSDLYKTDAKDKKYDIVIAGSFRARDFELVKKLQDSRDISILVITETQEDALSIKNTLKAGSVDIVVNDFSYSNMYKLVWLWKIYLNCSKYWSFSNWITWMLIPCSSSTMVLSYKNSFFKKIVQEWHDWFLYSDYDELSRKVYDILNMPKVQYDKVCKNRLDSFYNWIKIEDILIDKVFSKLK
jgi:hypothetical protein